MSDEYEVQKALGLTITVSCEITYTLNYVQPVEERKFRDVIFETFVGYGSSAHLQECAKEWLAEQSKGAQFISVRILYTLNQSKMGKYHGPSTTP